MQFASIGDGSFPSGTRIAVPGPDGGPAEVAVESLRQGDAVQTLAGAVAVRHVTTTTIAPAPVLAIPVRIAAGAMGGGLPRRDLVLPAEQLLHLRDATIPDGALAPLGALVNGATIRREPKAAAQAWHRLELERPGVVLAEGLAVYARHDPTAPPFAPILPPGPTIHALRTLLARPAPAPEPEAAPEPMISPELAALLDHPDPPVLRLVANGAPVVPHPDSTAAEWHFMLPSGTSRVLLVSPPGIAANTPPSGRAKARRFGIALFAVLLDEVPLALDGAALHDGFHPIETAGNRSWRWTNGTATITIEPVAEPRRMTLRIADWHKLLERVAE